jgi:hypothetical protein
MLAHEIHNLPLTSTQRLAEATPLRQGGIQERLAAARAAVGQQENVVLVKQEVCAPPFLSSPKRGGSAPGLRSAQNEAGHGTLGERQGRGRATFSSTPLRLHL